MPNVKHSKTTLKVRFKEHYNERWLAEQNHAAAEAEIIGHNELEIWLEQSI